MAKVKKENGTHGKVSAKGEKTGKRKEFEKLSHKQLAEKIHSEIKRFISMGKSRGYLTYEEINDLLPAEILSPEMLDLLMEALEQNDVKLVDNTAKKGRGKAVSYTHLTLPTIVRV